MIRFYFDEMMSRDVAHELRRQGIEVVMAIDVGMVEKDDDSEHLPFATAHDLVLVTQDRGFAGRAMKHANHGGLVCWVGQQFDVGGQVRVLAAFAEKTAVDAVKGRVFWIK